MSSKPGCHVSDTDAVGRGKGKPAVVVGKAQRADGSGGASSAELAQRGAAPVYIEEAAYRPLHRRISAPICTRLAIGLRGTTAADMFRCCSEAATVRRECHARNIVLVGTNLHVVDLALKGRIGEKDNKQ